MLRCAFLLTALASLQACTPTPYAVSQAGTVPAPRAMNYDGQPMNRDARIEARVTTVATQTEGLDTSYDSGNFVARHHAGVSARTRVGHAGTDIGLDFDTAFVDGSDPVQEGLGPRPDAESAWSLTWGVRHSIKMSEQLRVGLGFVMGLAEVPVRVGNAETESDSAGIYQFAVVPSYRIDDRLAVFGGMTISSEIDVPRTIVVDSSYDTPEARAADGVVILSAGASYTLDSGVRLQAQLAQPTGSEIAAYGTQLDFSIGFDLGDAGGPRTYPVGPPQPAGPPGTAPTPYPTSPYPGQ